MELFFSRDISAGICRLDADESAHCVRVLRHREGDSISVIDGEGTLYICTVLDASAGGLTARVEREEPGWGSHPYHLTMAVCPTKNNDRYEWFAEKATELGLDVVVPVIGDHSERKVFKTERLKRIMLSASKQSLKGAIPQVEEPCTVREFIRNCTAEIKLIACCFEGEVPRKAISETVRSDASIAVLIGPEGDFSHDEAALALDSGFIPVHIGPSRLRTETAALAAVAAVYIKTQC